MEGFLRFPKNCLVSLLNLSEPIVARYQLLDLLLPQSILYGLEKARRIKLGCFVTS